MYELADVEMSYGSSAMAPEGRGLLQVTSKRLIWKEQQQEAGAEGKVYEVEVPCITLHAISKDPSSFPKPCLYCQVDGWVWVGVHGGRGWRGRSGEAREPCFGAHFSKTRGRHTSLLNPEKNPTHASFPFLQISEGGEDEDEDEAKEVYFVPQDPESRKYFCLCVCWLIHIYDHPHSAPISMSQLLIFFFFFLHVI